LPFGAGGPALLFDRDYLAVDLGIVWRVVKDDLPPLARTLERADET